MALRDGRVGGRSLGGGSLDGIQRRNARMVQSQLERKTRHYKGSRNYGLRINSPAPFITSITPSYGSMVGGYAVTLVGDYFDMPEVGTPFISPQGTFSNPTSVVTVDEQTITCVWGSSAWFGQTDVYVYNHELNLATGTTRCFRYQPFEQVDATLFFRSPRYSVTSGVGTWKSSERGGPLSNYYPLGVASSAPVASSGAPVFTALTNPLTQADTMASWLGTGNCHTIAVIDLTSIGATAGYRAGDAIWTDANGSAGFSVYDASGTYYIEFWARVGGVDKRARTALGASSGRFVVQGKKEGGNLQVRLNAGAWVVGDACGTTDAGSTFIMGQNYNATANFRGTIWSLGTYNVAKDDATFSDLINGWAAVAYPVAVVKILDLDSRFTTNDGVTVSVMQDQSGNGFDATAPGGEEPTYVAADTDYNNIPSVYFPNLGTKRLDQDNSIVASMTAQYTMIMVGHVSNYLNASNAYFVMTTGGSPVGIFSQGLTTWTPYSSTASAPIVTNTNPAIRSIVAAVFTGGDTERFYQTSKFSQGNPTYGGEDITTQLRGGSNVITTGFRIGSWQTPSTPYSPSGPILRVIIYEGALSNAQIEAEFATLGALYNIQIQDDNTLGITGKWIAGNYSDSYIDYGANTVGRWLGQDTTGPTFGQDWLSDVAAATIPTLSTINGLNEPQLGGNTDYMYQSPTNYSYKPRRTIADLFASDGSAGTIIMGFIAQDAQTDTGTSYTNDGLITDGGANFGMFWSASGVWAVVADSIAPQSVLVPNTFVPATPIIAVMRWDGVTLEVSIGATVGVITWYDTPATAIAIRTNTVFIGTNYAFTNFLYADIGAIRTYNRTLTDDEVNEAGDDIQTTLGWSLGYVVNSTSPIAAQVDGVSTTTANLTGTGAIASTIAGVSTTTANLKGAGAIASTVAGVSTTTASLLGAGALADTIAGISTTTAALLGAGAIASTSNGVSTTTAALLGAGAIAATSTGASTTTANLLGTGVIASTTAGASTTTANLLGAGALASTTASTSTVIATLSLVAFINGVSTTTAALTGAGAIASTIAGASTTIADISGFVLGTATIAGTSTTTANLLGAGDVASTVNSVSTTTATLLGSGQLAATSTGVSTTTATGTLSGALVSATAGTSTTSAALLGAGQLSSTVSSAATVVATLDLIARINGSSTTTADLLATGTIVSTIPSASTTTANLLATGTLSSTIAGISTAIPALTGAGAIASTSNSTSTVIASADLTGVIVSTINGVATSTANLLGAGALNAQIDGVATCILSSVEGEMVAACHGTGDATGAISGLAPILSTSSATSTTTASLVGDGQLTATTNGIASSTANLIASGTLSSTVDGIAAIVASPSGFLPADATITSTSTTVADLLATGTLTATSTSTSTTIANAIGVGAIQATIAGTSTTQFDNNSEAHIIAQIDGVSTITAALRGALPANAQINNVSTVVASLQGSGLINSQTNAISTSIATLRGSGSINSQIDSTSITLAPLRGSGIIAAQASSTATVIATVLGAGAVVAQVNSISTTIAPLRGAVAATAQVNGTATVIANAKGAGTISSHIAGTATVAPSIQATGLFAAYISSAATTSALLAGTGNILATSNSAANVISELEIFDPNKLIIWATIHGVADINAYIVNYLADKRIQNLSTIVDSNVALAVSPPPVLIYELPDPIVIPPVVPPDPSPYPIITRSGDRLVTPITPSLIVEFVEPPIPEVPVTPPVSLSISKSGVKLTAPITPTAIVDSDEPIN